jgi:alkane 1-monooxygenase
MLWAPVQTGLLIWLLLVFATDPPPPLDFAGLVLSFGIAAGGIGITIAHELTHRPGWLERRLADLLMVTVGYHHFCIEHVHGHHRRVATPHDPATALYGESIYRFFLRTTVGQFFSAWELESARQRRRGLGWLDPRNRVLVGVLATFAYYILVGVFAGWQAFVFVAAFGVVAVFLLETINYTEHYGLMRRQISPGRYEPIAPRHSWDASERLTSWLLVNLQRHADHHMRPGVAYPGLVVRGDAPQLPAGYATMLIVAMIPPLWFRVMNPRVEAWRAAQPPLDAAPSPV